jgi:phage terminase small subunit
MLTDRKKAFADAVLRGLSQKDAAVAIGLSEKTAKQAGSRMAKDPDVVDYLKRARKVARANASGQAAPKAEKATPAANWPLGVFPNEPKAPEAPGPEPEIDPDEDDGLTDEQRAGLSPLDYLLAIMRSSKASKSARMQAAIQAAPYIHGKIAPQGKKEAKNEAAKKAGRFAPSAPPRLVAAGGKKL